MDNTQAAGQRYTLKYLKIYVWQGLSILLNLCSLFVVLPSISTNKGLYGIYSVCIALTIFLSYVDLGFINAGVKFAAEHFARGEKEEEKRTISFSVTILAVFVLLYAVIVTYTAFHPQSLFRDLNPAEKDIAHKLLLTLAIFSPLVVLQRTLQIIFQIRVEDYIFQGVLICSNLLKIFSVFYFFRKDHYDVVGYFVFYQSCSFLGLIVANVIAQLRYKLSFFSICRYLGFQKDIFDKTKHLALSSLALTISWVLYYEIDPYVLARISTPQIIAVYSVGLTLLSFFRAIFGALYSPFNARFNHLMAVNDENALRGLYSSVITFLLPLVVFPILTVVILAKPFIFSWVGPQFADGVWAARFLVLSNILGFIAYPCSILLIAQKKVRALYVISFIQPFLYWAGIALFYPVIGFTIFAICKWLSFLLIGVLYFVITLRYLNINLLGFLKRYIIPVLPSLICLILLGYLGVQFLPLTKGIHNLLLVIGAGGMLCLIALVLYYCFSAVFREYINSIFGKVRTRTAMSR